MEWSSRPLILAHIICEQPLIFKIILILNIQIELETGTSGVALSYFKPKDVLVASFLGGDIRIVDLNGNSFRKIKVTFTEI